MVSENTNLPAIRKQVDLITNLTLDSEVNIVLPRRKKVYVSYGYNGYASWMKDFDLVYDIRKADLVLLAGGEDINPALYDDSSVRGYYSPKRDDEEINDYNYAIKHNLKLWGTCRGLQLMCCLENGGKLIYDVRHGGGHMVNTFDKCVLSVNSLHHQMCNPTNIKPDEYKLLAWCKKGSSTFYHNGSGKNIPLPDDFKEPEAIWFPYSQGIGVQFHPEMMRGTAAQLWCGRMLSMLMEDTLENYYNVFNKTVEKKQNESTKKSERGPIIQADTSLISN